MRISLKDIEENIKPLGGKLSYDKNFIFELLGVYGRSPANITRLKSGQLNVADDKDNDVAQKNVVYFKPADVSDDELYTIVDDLKSSLAVVRHSTRFVIATNYHKLRAIDTKTNEPLDIDIRDIDRHYAFFLPWAGMEKAQFITENHADVKAAEKMAKLFDILIEHNGYKTPHEWHHLTTFFTRLLFCYFAEDTNIFKKNQFVNALASYTQEDGSDIRMFLTVLFESLDEKDKDSLPAHISAFPYVNGHLFGGISEIPHFNKTARKLLIESASQLDWSQINPDIFGSMFQAIVRPSERTGFGQHYTSVPNIMKTIEPLFMNELKDEFDKHYDDANKLDALLTRISRIKIFDPACGSGNFLIIAYKELRRLEHAILERQTDLRPHQTTLFGSKINIENFYGIEIDDFAHEVAILSLWLAKHQMNIEFTEKFGIDLPLIPLKESGNIIQGNATRVDWEQVCPVDEKDEVYLIGNPPYIGFNEREKPQRDDMGVTFKDAGNVQRLDYVSCWFEKGSTYIKGKNNTALAFVSTNSICQGEQVALLWPRIFNRGLEIEFAYTSFKWANNAQGGAGVFCCIIALRNENKREKAIYTSDGLVRSVQKINAYLVSGNSGVIYPSKTQVSGLPEMQLGSSAIDGGHLILNPDEAESMIAAYPSAKKFIKRFMGGTDFINSKVRYCLWIDDEDVNEAFSIPPIRDRINKCRDYRLSAGRDARKASSVPHRFFYRKFKDSEAIIFPMTSSEKREHIPVGYAPKGTILSNGVFSMYGAEPYLFGILSSQMHRAWISALSGQLETRIRYSNTIVYNNFPLPALTDNEKAAISERVYSILDSRELYPERTLAALYDTNKMPSDLRIAHQQLDDTVDNIYRRKPFANNEERLTHLFDLYDAMTVKERNVS